MRARPRTPGARPRIEGWCVGLPARVRADAARFRWPSAVPRFPRDETPAPTHTHSTPRTVGPSPESDP
jgi:hypothetical protein